MDWVTIKNYHALFDAISLFLLLAAIEKREFDENTDYMSRYVEILKKEDFKELISRRTTNVANILARINMASLELYGVTYEK